jgi:hypothetical protein
VIRSIPDLAESQLLDLALLALKEAETRAEGLSHLTQEELLQPGRLNVSTQIILDRERRFREQFASSRNGPPVSGETSAAA